MNNIFYPKQLNKIRIITSENQCFFAMPISDEYTNLYDTISLYLENEGYKCVRDDNNLLASVPIINLILNGIATSQYIIVDVSEPNANVFYELGITHTVKDIENVFIIKEKNSKTPFDIHHLQYIEYDKNNLKALAYKLLERLKANQYKNALKRSVALKQILKFDDLDDFVDYFSKIFEESNILIYTSLLEGSISDIASNHLVINAIWEYDKVLRNEIKIGESEPNIAMLFKIFIEILIPCSKIDEISKYIMEFLNNKEFSLLYENELIPYQTELALKFAEKSKMVDITTKWIIEYFQRSKSTKVDLNRYRLEAFLLKTNLDNINQAIVNGLLSENKYIREHMADIAGEKKLYIAEENLITQLKREKVIYVISSIVEALGKINSKKALEPINDWLIHNSSEVINNKEFFVLKHIRNALLRIDPKKSLNEFDKKYLDVIIKNMTI